MLLSEVAMGHYSARLQRDFEDGDLLFRSEVAEVLSANSGRAISPTNVSWLVDLGRLHPVPLHARVYQYQYSEVKDMVISTSPGRRRLPPGELSPGARRQRAFRERHGLNKRRNPEQ